LPGFLALILCEQKRFWQDPVRIGGRMIQPLLYLVALGAGFGRASMLGEAAYPAYIFPGVLAISLLNTATYSATNLVFERETGLFKAVLVAPVSRRTIAAGKVSACALLAWLQSLPLLLAAPWLGLRPGPLALGELLLAMLLSALVFAAIGVAVASRLSSTLAFPIVSNAVMLPMFFAGGALFPLGPAPRWLQGLALVDPVAYSVDLMRGTLLGKFFFHPLLSLGGLSLSLVLLLHFSVQAFERGEDI
jgi:ABC-2 type transport system permease protein